MTNAQAARKMASEINVMEVRQPAWGDAQPQEKVQARPGWHLVPLWRRLQILAQALRLVDWGRL